ncbi:hypothetical protein DOTSEDRAFT_21648 [Dothistroma septosporum NZE10]|uniref:Uncharacterized protein n=1 Tax=Dothistroma septosporum (strain NZE10 / CBS 128990) TaxID=675120 RepID=N1PWX7_DOTSN|nr:hypothetical protein DOTSEDRAFT_21648 [Dothistroma septosporum NZE10]
MGPWTGGYGTQIEVTTASSGGSTGSTTHVGKALATLVVPQPEDYGRHPATADWEFDITDELRQQIADAINEACQESGYYLDQAGRRRDIGSLFCKIGDLTGVGQMFFDGRTLITPKKIQDAIVDNVIEAPAALAPAYAQRGKFRTQWKWAFLLTTAILHAAERINYVPSHFVVGPGAINDVMEDDQTPWSTRPDGTKVTTTSTTSEAPSCPTDAYIDPNDDQGQDGIPPEASIQGELSSAYASMAKAVGLIPGAGPQTCTKTVTAPVPSCKLTKQTTNINQPSRVCVCPFGSITQTVPTSTSTITTCDGNGSGTHIDVCPWTAAPPTSLNIPLPTGMKYPGGTMPPVQTQAPYNNPTTDPGWDYGVLSQALRDFCHNRATDRLHLGDRPNDTVHFLETHNNLGKKSIPKNQDFAIWLGWEPRACADEKKKVAGYTFLDEDEAECVSTFMAIVNNTPNKPKPKDQLGGPDFKVCGGMYHKCVWYEIAGRGKFPKMYKEGITLHSDLKDPSG